MTLPKNHLELLSPARDAEIGRQAVLHGADAVYIGGPSFGARSKADNSVADIAALASFAHRYGSRIFVTVNTILHDNELESARRYIHELYDAGVDALIVQDMGILELDIPPIALHASTQCDIRTVEKAKFLGDVGFSQLVLARELTLQQIAAMRAAVNPNVPLEYFVHGALCVAFSGNCYISEAHTGRSANRGSCSQECRLPYTLEDAQGRVVAFDKHLLSMKDNNQSANLAALVDAGIRSFKIEGRYKDVGYVKNITAHYRTLIDGILEARPELAAASHGHCTYSFTPDPDKTFNRSNTDYFATG
ncbi:MAG TPA: peptidase U32 family protein, partial [Casimicrobium sp.]|nr:peptidase U32 family protein [Casimicrobium sp.]